jgi:hypothetical protein
MPAPPRYSSDASSAPRLRWDERPVALSVLAASGDARPSGGGPGG